MSTQKRFKTTTLLSALCMVLLCACGSPKSQLSTTNVEPLFTEVNVNTTQAVVNPESLSSSSRTRFVNVNTSLLKRAMTSNDRTVLFNFFEDQLLQITLENIKQISDSNFVASGFVAGDAESQVSIVLNEDVLLANVHLSNADESYEVRYNANGVHVVTLPKAHDPDCETEDAAAAPGEVAMSATVGADVTALAAPVIDVLVAYTPNAKSRQGGGSAMKALIQMGIADTNRAFIDSGINLQVRLAGTMELKQNESSWSSDLGRLRSSTDGRWDEVHAERRRLGADQVTVVGSYSTGANTAGVGYINAGYSNAFTIVKASAFGQYTFSHELGHNLGLNHSDGYTNKSGKFRTIMAYGNYTRIRRFSNPNRTYNGYTTGSASQYEVAIVNRNAVKLATFVTPTGARPLMMMGTESSRQMAADTAK